MGRNVRALTLREVAGLMEEITGQAVTDRRVRYLLIGGRLGADADARAHGRTRLYGSLDVALVRLALALRTEGVSPQLTRVVLTYLRAELVRAWRAGSPLAIALRGMQATLEPAIKGQPPKTDVWIPLRTIWQGLDTRVQEVADTRDEVWMYRPVRAAVVPRNTA